MILAPKKTLIGLKQTIVMNFKKNNLICIIPARSGSKGLMNKNIRKLGPDPLLAWPINSAKETNLFDKIIVSTDSLEYQNISLNYGASCPFLRPKNLSSDKASSIDVVFHTLDYLKEKNDENYDYVCVLEPTSPLTSSDDIVDAFDELFSHHNAQSLVGIGKVESQHPNFICNKNQDSLLTSAFKDLAHTRRQDIKDNFFYLDGSIYLSSVSALKKYNSFYHEFTIGKIFPKYKNLEIDDEADFKIISAIISDENIR